MIFTMSKIISAKIGFSLKKPESGHSVVEGQQTNLNMLLTIRNTIGIYILKNIF